MHVVASVKYSRVQKLLFTYWKKAVLSRYLPKNPEDSDGHWKQLAYHIFDNYFQPKDNSLTTHSSTPVEVMPPRSKQQKQANAAVCKNGQAAAIGDKKQQQAPNWPIMQPVMPASDLELVTLLSNQILTIPRLWTTSLSKHYVTFLSSLPLVTTPGKPGKGDAVRVNDRYQIEDANFAGQLWSATALKELVEKANIEGQALSDDEKRVLWGGEVLGLNSNIRIYRYKKGQFFDQHCMFRYPHAQAHRLTTR